jgi:hypothetical protein
MTHQRKRGKRERIDHNNGEMDNNNRKVILSAAEVRLVARGGARIIDDVTF